MLSKILSNDIIEESAYTKYIPPSHIEINEIIEINNKTNERTSFIEANKDDPEKAAKIKADEILSIAQKKYKSMEIEAQTLKIKVEDEIRQKLNDEFDMRLNDSVQKANKNFISSLEDIALLKRTIYDNSEQKLLKLVFEIVEKVIEGEVKTNPDIIIDMLKKGFERIENADKYEIRINPADFGVLSENKKRIDDIIKTGAEIKFIKSDKVERGGCIIKTGMGEIITEPLKQLETIQKEILGE